jgi:hypothetical protein
MIVRQRAAQCVFPAEGRAAPGADAGGRERLVEKDFFRGGGPLFAQIAFARCPCVRTVRDMLRAAAVLFLATGLVGAELPPPANGLARVVIAPTKTSIYIGSVALALEPFLRNGDTYSAAYQAKVFPYFFLGEGGELSVRVSEDSLQKLQAGEPIDFSGRAVNRDGEERRIEGRASPADTLSGKLKVRVFVSPRIELIFNTTYRFDPAGR